MNVFIDTNILLDMYQLSGPDLDELKKIVKLIGAGKMRVYLPKQVEDEFWRNRESVISDAIKLFKETKASAKLPNLVRLYKKTSDLREAVESVNVSVKEITKQLEYDIENNLLKADEIIQELFQTAITLDLDFESLEKARLRVEIGNPPGKRGSLGDAINWELLLENVPTGEDLKIISSDGDFESFLKKGKAKEYLSREWRSSKNSELTLCKALPEFLQEYFPDIKLSDEVDKIAAIEQLEDSCNFQETHKIIAKLSAYDDFKDEEAKRIISAYLNNNQVYWILGDEDILIFAKKIIEFVKTEETADLAFELQATIDSIEAH